MFFLQIHVLVIVVDYIVNPLPFLSFGGLACGEIIHLWKIKKRKTQEYFGVFPHYFLALSRFLMMPNNLLLYMM